MTTPNRLSPKAQEALSGALDDRIKSIRSEKWFKYGKAEQVLNKLEDLLKYPQRSRMPNLLLVGETNNGKTMIIERFQKRHPAFDNPEGKAVTIPVFSIQAPPKPDESRFYSVILDRLFAPFRTNDRVEKKQFQAIRILRYAETKMIIIDEIHHLLAGSSTKQRQLLNTIKYLGNELRIPIVGVGTKDAYRAIQVDPQLANRFEHSVLPRWDYGEEYLKLLASFEYTLPLKKPSGLTKSKIARLILHLSEGSIGEICRLISDAAVISVQNGDERITEELIKSLDWCPPSKRGYAQM